MESTIVSKEQFSRGGPWEMSDILKLPNMQDVLEVLGKENTQAYFDEYVTLHPSVEPISAKNILPHVLEIVGGTEPTYTSLYKRARDPPTDEHWAECLFAYRMKRYLESRECMAINWRSTLLHNPEERRDSRAIAWESLSPSLGNGNGNGNGDDN
ncbi:uncharacterized protein F4807DRAFT_456370 [Annulohypoxylon truncatum]|uniref:uncharacterized protein n=1 Tax=Annulohypoxylon truncatum TaxID=327061 RepID=UPI002007A0BB|nr:uncharacterized protein F4807DRAFT_456370 [Annulohypoxylon truncatum]KAI1213822.1 hypothetical protein F4807DRAFT_456370 [Annulohypoxylon truncatum]